MKTNMIQEKLKELELQLNYVCYDKELITRLSKVWESYYDLKSEVKKLNIPDVIGQSEQLKTFLSKLVKEFDNGEVSWNTRDDAEIMIKSF